MRAILVDRTQPEGIAYAVNHPDPTVGPGEVLVRVDLAGICSTDLEIVRGYMNFQGVLGHEFVGTVVRGSESLKGQRVVAEINCVGPASAARDADARKHAADHTVLGIDRHDGVFAEYAVVPAENCHVVPNEVSNRQAVFVEPLAAACQVVKDHPATAGMRVAVLGTGRLGLLCGQVLAAQDCRLIVIGRSPHTLRIARQLSLPTMTVTDLDVRPAFDMVVECTGSPDGFRLAAGIVRPRGTIVLKSTYAQNATLDLAPIVVNEIVVAGNRCGPFPEALELLRTGRVRVEELISGVYPFARAVAAFAAAREPNNLKILLEPGAV
jgi:threonine dehydrogenase-like Zn-dependent dehydrogenase